VIKPASDEEVKVLYSQSCRLARSTQGGDLLALKAQLTDVTFLAKLDTDEAYQGQAKRLRVAGVLQVLAENPSRQAQEVLLSLTTSRAFVEHPARVDLLIQALVQIKPAPEQAVVFWDKRFQPQDGHSGVTVWALLDNGSVPAISLFEKKMVDERFPETERRYWLTGPVVQHRNDLILLQGCERLLNSLLEEPYRLLMVDVLFDYKPEDWYGARYWYRPPPRAKASKEALEQLRVIGRKALENQLLGGVQKGKIELVLQELDALLDGGK
jgi:hypothetical protein